MSAKLGGCNYDHAATAARCTALVKAVAFELHDSDSGSYIHVSASSGVCCCACRHRCCVGYVRCLVVWHHPAHADEEVEQLPRLVDIDANELPGLSLFDEASHEALTHQPLLDAEVVDWQQVQCGAQLLLSLTQQLTLLARVDGEGRQCGWSG